MCEENREEKGKGNPRRLSSVRWGLRAAHVICRWAPTVSGVVVRARSHGALDGVPRPAPALKMQRSLAGWCGRVGFTTIRILWEAGTGLGGCRNGTRCPSASF
jgi:hypothetical protein